jgi:hypothetical protein
MQNARWLEGKATHSAVDSGSTSPHPAYPPLSFDHRQCQPTRREPPKSPTTTPAGRGERTPPASPERVGESHHAGGMRPASRNGSDALGNRCPSVLSILVLCVPRARQGCPCSCGALTLAPGAPNAVSSLMRYAACKDRRRNRWGTVPIFVRRKWDCPLAPWPSATVVSSPVLTALES